MDNAGTRHKAEGDGDGDGNNGAGHELKRKSLLNQRRVEKGVVREGSWLESYAAALANRKSMLPKICAEWQLRVLHVKSERGRWAAGEVAEFPLYLCPAAAASLCLMATRHTTRRKWLEKPAPTTRQMSPEAQAEPEEEPEEEPEGEPEEETEGEPEEEPE